MSSDRAKRLLEFADAVDADRGFSTGLTHEMRDCAAHIEALEGEVAFVKAQLAGTNKNIAGWLQARDDATMRAAVAELDRDRLAGEVARLAEERDRFLTGGLEADNRTLRATRRAEAAESERDRLQLANARMKAALEAISEGDKPTTYMHLGTALAIARKALGDAS